MAQPHSDIELQAARRHFFGGIATNCLNNSNSAPLSPSSSPLRTASSSPLIAVLALPLARKRCCRGDQNRRADFGSHVNSLTAHCIFRYFGDEVGKTIEILWKRPNFLLTFCQNHRKILILHWTKEVRSPQYPMLSWVSRNLVGINFRHPNVMPNFAVWKTITYRHWHRWCCQPRF